MAESLTRRAEPYATTGTKPSVVSISPLATFTSARDAGTCRTELKNAISQRRRHPLSPLVAEQWHSALLTTHLLTRYPLIPQYIRHGALAGIPRIHHSFTPLNNQSTEELSDVFCDIIQTEFNKGRYIGPFSQEELEMEIGPFQSSPLSLVPKAGKPGKYRLIQNLSYPHTNLPIPSINSQLNSDDFPCTWGTFRSICTLIRGLPRGAQAATRDISEAYRIIPLHESQWAGVVVRISNQPALFALNTSNCFGGATAGGLFGLFGDALADILRARGIGPILKWVDDFLFIRIPRDDIAAYNKSRESNRQIVLNNGGKQQSGGRLWFKGKVLADLGAEHFAEDFSSPIKHICDHFEHNTSYPYGFQDIDNTTAPLGVPWEASKDTPFNSVVIFAGLAWDLEEKTVSLPESKKGKYSKAISDWNNQATHTLEDVQKLHGKLLYACHVVPQGRAYLTNLEKMMGTFHERPFTPRHPPRHLVDDLTWWQNRLNQPSLSRSIPGNRHFQDIGGYSDASSSVGIGIVIGKRWRAWRLLPGWKAAGRDIGWAEAVGMELLLRSIFKHQSYPGIKIFGDNKGVIEGWWSGRSRNAETNRVFRRIHELLEKQDSALATRYVHTSNNPADGPSRGIHPPENLLLPPIDIPEELRHFIVNFDSPLHPNERNPPHRLSQQPKESSSTAERRRRHQANADADQQTDKATEASTTA